MRPIDLPHDGGGSLSSSDCRDPYDSDDYADIYSFELAAQSQVTINLTSSAFDAYLRLLDDRGGEVARNDDEGSGLNSLITRTLAPGAYQIVATDANSGRGRGAYQLRVAVDGATVASRPCEVVGNMRLTDVSVREVGAWTSSDCRSDWTGREYSDRWRFEVARPGQVTIDLVSATDAYLTLLGADGAFIEADDDDGPGYDYDSRIVRFLDAGTYHLEASTYVTRAEGSYELRVTAGGSSSNCIVRPISLPHSGGGSLAGDDCRGPLRTHAYADIYSFELSAESRLTIDLASGAFDTYLYLLDDRGVEIARDDDGGRDLNSRLARTLQPGTYQIVATSYYRTATGSYDLSVTAGGSSSRDCAVRSISLPHSGGGSLTSDDCRGPLRTHAYADIYSFELSAESRLTIDLASGAFDTYLYLLDDRGVEIARDDDGGRDLNSRLARTLQPGTYQIAATSYYRTATGAYELTVAADGRVSTSCSATDLGVIGLDRPGASRQGEWTDGDCRSDRQQTNGSPSDAYTFDVREESPVTVTLTFGNSADVWVWLLDSDGNDLVNQDTGQPARARGIPGGVEVTAGSLPAGTYTIEVTTVSGSLTASLGGSYGSYELSVAVGGSVSRDCAVRPISLPYDGDGSLAGDDCRGPLRTHAYADIYSFELSAESRLTIDLASGAFDTYLYLLDDRGVEIALDDDSGSGRNSRITRTLQPGTYQIVATSYYQTATGSYELSVATGGSVNMTCPAINLGPIALNHPGVFRQGEWTSNDCRSDRRQTSGSPSDVYTFDAREGSPVTVTLTTASGGDAWVWLLDSNGNNLVNQDTGQPASARGVPGGVEVTADRLPTGTYTLEVTTIGGGLGDYQLRLAVEERFDERVDDPCGETRQQSWVDTVAEVGWNDPSIVHRAKALLTRVLFQIALDQNVVHCTNADYNDFGEPADLPGYRGGHAGWDVQTWNVGGPFTADVPFYSLTEGTVVYANGARGWVAVCDGPNDCDGPDDQGWRTVYYLHARHVYVRQGQRVAVGQRLGIQGDTGSTGREHIHIEVHRGWQESDNPDKPAQYHGNLPGAVQSEGGGTLLLWHEQLNYLCRASASDWLHFGGNSCPELTESNARNEPSR